LLDWIARVGALLARARVDASTMKHGAGCLKGCHTIKPGEAAKVTNESGGIYLVYHLPEALSKLPLLEVVARIGSAAKRKLALDRLFK
jgi:hypothetical protein